MPRFVDGVEYLTIEELSKKSGWPVSTLKRLQTQKEMTVFPIGRSTWFTEEAFGEAIKKKSKMPKHE